MAEFDKIWVNCVEDESLYGKYGFFSDSIDDLKRHVANNSLKYWGKLSHNKSTSVDLPFVNEKDELHYRFFYYDPKLFIFFGNPPGRIVTHRELSRWLAQGNGEGIYTIPSCSPHLTFTEFRYMRCDADEPVKDIAVRKWKDDDFRPPTSYYLGFERRQK